MLKDNLNIDLPIKILEARAYSTALYQWEMPLSLGGFSQDFPDAHNMLTMVWRSQPRPYGRQSWKNDTFDDLVDQAAVEMQPEKRMQHYADAQKILTEDVGGVFLFYQKEASLRKPWFKGFRQNKISEFPFRSYMDIYIGNERAAN